MILEFPVRSLLKQLGMKHEGSINLKDVFTSLYKNGQISERDYLFICSSLDRKGTEQSSISL